MSKAALRLDIKARKRVHFSVYFSLTHSVHSWLGLVLFWEQNEGLAYACLGQYSPI